MTTDTRGWVILDGKAYIISSLEESDCFEVGTRFVSLSLIELEEYGTEEE
jgi:hypothetical protein